jgi:FkbM family methyltransferase
MQNWAFTVKDHILRNDYERGEFTIISETLKPEDKVLEIGTGLGFLAIYCSKIVGANNVFSFEANPFLQTYHKQIFNLNGLTPEVYYNAAGVSDSELTFYIDSKTFWSSSLQPFSSKNLQKVNVKVLNINSIIERIKPTYLIIDVEGYELQLIHSISGFINIRKIQIEIHPTIIGEYAPKEIEFILTNQGFLKDTNLSSQNQFYFYR